MKVLEFMKSGRLNDWLLNIVLLSVLLLVGVLVYWQASRYDLLEIKTGNYSLDKTVYKQGEMLPIRFHLCKKANAEEEVYGRFVDGVIYSVPQKGSRFKPGCYDTYISSVSIPINLPEGKYVYEETIIYKVNPIRTVEYTFTTPEFSVIK